MIDGDVLDAASLTQAVKGCHVVVHLAAIAGVDTVLQMPVLTMKVSIIGTYNALESARRARDRALRRLLHQRGLRRLRL